MAHAGGFIFAAVVARPFKRFLRNTAWKNLAISRSDEKLAERRSHDA
jgi:hypothetical protein